jgi:drug/metabolite transporter (DMT)-like permease
MSRELAGALVAVLAAALYGIAVGLQALEARRVPAEHVLRVSLVRRLVRRPLWLTGAVVGAVGWVLQGVALSFAPLTLVEPALAFSLVFLLLIGARVLSERVGVRELAGTLAVAGGVAGIGVGAPHHNGTHVNGLVLLIALACLGTVVAAPHLLSEGRSSGVLIATSAGVAYGAVGLCTKFAADDRAASAWRAMFAWLLVLGAIAAVGVLSEMSALQIRPATQVAPIVFGLNIAVPVALAPVLARESWDLSSLARARLVVSLVAVVAGAAILSRSSAVGAVLESDAEEAQTPLDAATAPAGI